MMGTNFADGRGNISIAFSTNTRKAAYQRDRSWYRDLWANPNIGGTAVLPGSVGRTTWALPTCRNAAVHQRHLQPGSDAARQHGLHHLRQSRTARPRPASTRSARQGAYRNTVVDGYNYKKLANGQLAKNNTDNLLILPLERYNVYARRQLRDQRLAERVRRRQLQQGQHLDRAGAGSDHERLERSSSPMTAALCRPSCRRSSTRVPIRRSPGHSARSLPFNRASTTDVFTYNMTAGLDGKIPGTDWTWEAFAQQGESETNVKQTGFVSLQRLRTVMSAPNWGAGFTASSNQGAPDFGFGGATAHCTSGINPFNYGQISQDCIDAVSANLKTRAVMQQSVWEFDAQGSLFELPAGKVSAAIGASYRHNSYHFDNDTYVTQGTMFNDQILGLYPSGNSQGRIEAQGSLWRVAGAGPGRSAVHQEARAGAGCRASDYNTTGTSYTYKALASWDVDQLAAFARRLQPRRARTEHR